MHTISARLILLSKLKLCRNSKLLVWGVGGWVVGISAFAAQPYWIWAWDAGTKQGIVRLTNTDTCLKFLIITDTDTG